MDFPIFLWLSYGDPLQLHGSSPSEAMRERLAALLHEVEHHGGYGGADGNFGWQHMMQTMR